MDKNPEQDSKWIRTKNLVDKNILNSILCTEPFVKTAFLSRFIKVIDYPIIYLDFDLLYSGYVQSNILTKRDGLHIIRPSRKEWQKILRSVLLKISKKKYCIIIDTLNGFFNIFNEKDSLSLINAYIMLICSVGRESNSTLLLTSIVRKKDSEGWILSPTGRHIIDSRHIKQIMVSKTDTNLMINFFDNKNKILLYLEN